MSVISRNNHGPAFSAHAAARAAVAVTWRPAFWIAILAGFAVMVGTNPAVAQQPVDGYAKADAYAVTEGGQMRAQPVDQAVGDLDPLATSLRRVPWGLRVNGEQSSVLSLPRLSDGYGRGGVVDPRPYVRVGPGFRARVTRLDYVVPVYEAGPGSRLVPARNVASARDGWFIEQIPADTVFDLRLSEPLASESAANARADHVSTSAGSMNRQHSGTSADAAGGSLWSMRGMLQVDARVTASPAGRAGMARHGLAAGTAASTADSSLRASPRFHLELQLQQQDRTLMSQLQQLRQLAEQDPAAHQRLERLTSVQATDPADQGDAEHQGSDEHQDSGRHVGGEQSADHRAVAPSDAEHQADASGKTPESSSP